MVKTIEIDLCDLEELKKENRNLKEVNKKLGEWVDKLTKDTFGVAEENKKLKEFKTKREESRFYFKAQMERAEPKTASEAEDLQKAKEMFEKLYREELYYLEEENKKLKEENEKLRIGRELDKGNTIFGM